MGFGELVVTDVLVMGAIANFYGLPNADILSMPVDPEQTINNVCDAVAPGRISELRIDKSLQRIW